ncbi:MAG: hypothetical protein K6G29_06755 [Clostridiales bacterium]|nr:hypothetical protein [Clostridiales bacterium]
MTDRIAAADPAALKKAFLGQRSALSPYIYLPLDTKGGLDREERIAKLFAGYKKSGFWGVIPFSNKNFALRPLSEEIEAVWGTVVREAEVNDLALGYLDDTYVMREYLKTLPPEEEAGCRILSEFEYACSENTTFKKKLHTTGPLMALCAVNDDDLTILDLRDRIEDGAVVWDVPAGNWNVMEFVCEPDPDAHYIDMMDYRTSSDYLKRTAGALLDRIDAEGQVFRLFIARNVLYAGRNRRMWHPDFNRAFREAYGFDPAPYYPLLFRGFPGHSGRYKSLMMSLRAKMLTDGYLKAVSDFCHARSLFSTGFPAESKATFCSWLFGDGQMLHRWASAPGVSLPFAYLYGLNGIKVASGAADQFGADTVSADLFKYYSTLTKDIIYRESMNAFVRGVNMVFAHLGEDRTEKTDIVEGDGSVWGSIFSKGDDLSDFASYVTRVQTLLRGGEHVCEAAIVYPIHSLHSYVALYQSNNTEFEYPSTPENADYMELMNNFLNYVGIDTLFLHPDILAERTFSEDGFLYLPGEHGAMKLKILVLPSMSLISLKTLRVIRKFFDDGGKILATDALPTGAFECAAIPEDTNRSLKEDSPEDLEVRELIRAIFGESVDDPHVIRSYYKNENDNGGIAYFLPANKTCLDGTDTVAADILLQAVRNFGTSPDILIERRPRVEFLGVVNQHLPDFMKIGIDKRLARGCSMNALHKRYAGCDIYFFSNTTGKDYNGHVLLRGRLQPEEWNPMNGKIRRSASELVRVRGEIYTRVQLSVEATSCVFLVSPIARTQRELIRDLLDGETIPEYFPRD